MLRVTKENSLVNIDMFSKTKMRIGVVVGVVFILIIVLSMSSLKGGEESSSPARFLSAAISKDGRIFIGTERGLIRGQLIDGHWQEEEQPLKGRFNRLLSSIRPSSYSQAITLVSASPHLPNLIFTASKSDFFRSQDGEN